MQFSMISVKPMSLPPIVSDTTPVPAFRPLNWGGFGPGSTFCASVMSLVVAPLQLTSVRVSPFADAVRCA
jgi:hypothetical protein